MARRLRKRPRQEWTARHHEAEEALRDVSVSLADAGRLMGITRERVRQLVIEIGGIAPRQRVRKPNICDVCRDEIAEEIAGDATYQTIANEIGVSYSTVAQHCAREGINARARKAARVDEWVKMYLHPKKPMSSFEIARVTGWHRMTVYRALAERGVIRSSKDAAVLREQTLRRAAKVDLRSRRR